MDEKADTKLSLIIIGAFSIFTFIGIFWLYITTPKYITVQEYCKIRAKEHREYSYASPEAYKLICIEPSGEILKVEVDYKTYYSYNINDLILITTKKEK